MPTRIARLILGMWLFAACAAAEQPAAARLVIEPYSFRTYDGNEVPAELGKLWVRENRSGSPERLIQLAFVRLKSTAERPGSPIVFLAGGPGAPGIGMGRVPVYFRLFPQLRTVADVILLDQRGLGMSSPALDCPATPVPADVFASSANWLSVLTRKSRACADAWRARGVDVSAYTNDASADDLDELRRALGAEQHIRNCQERRRRIPKTQGATAYASSHGRATQHLRRAAPCARQQSVLRKPPPA